MANPKRIEQLDLTTSLEANDVLPIVKSGETSAKSIKASDVKTYMTEDTTIPSGGTTGQVLKKQSDSDYDTDWENNTGILPIGGTTGQVLVKTSGTDYDAEWSETSTEFDKKTGVSVDDTTPSYLEDKITAGTGVTLTTNNPAGDENLEISVDTDTIATQTYVESQISDSGSVLTNSDYLAGEDLSEGDSLFLEENIVTGDADQTQNIGDISGNTRVSARAIGSGVASNTLKLNLAVQSLPSVDLGVRIETDDGSGNPSGTLVDANATSTVTAASLTGSLADTTVTLAGNITITKGDIVHIVLYQGTYGSEVVNAVNYYQVGYSINDTTTRGTKLYNTSRGSVDTDKRIYKDSDLFEDTLYSKTDARYTYKLPDIPRIATKNYNAGDLVKYDFKGISKHLTGLTKGTILHISDTPGALSTISGTNELIVGDVLDDNEVLINIQNKYIGGVDTDLLISDDTEKVTYSGTFVKVKEILINSDFKFVVKFDLKNSNATVYTASAQIYKNGIAYGTLQTNTNGPDVETKSEILSFNKGDLLQIYAKTSDVIYYTGVLNLRLYGGKVYSYMPAKVNNI